MKKYLLILSFLPLTVLADDEKLADDPTRVATTFGISYATDFSSDNTKFSASLALDPIRKISVSINDDASEWRVGGSWLFDIGIVNFNVGQNTYDQGASQTNYSIGTFVPLSFFDIEPYGIQLFPMAGYTYNEGDIACDQACQNEPATMSQDYVLVPSTSHSAYIGAFALRPLTSQLTAIGFTGASVGSNDYFGYWAGAGLGYRVSEKHSISSVAYLSDNPYGSETLMSVSYRYEF